MGTQWRIGFNGPTGMDYSALYPLLDRHSTSDSDWSELFDDIQTLEQAALEALSEKDD